jgi:hypothetical protein
MPVIDGRGYSENTREKEEDFRYIVHTVAGKVFGINRNVPFIYFDLYAGSGYNSEVNCMGSPVVSIAELERYNLNYTAYLIDIEEKNTLSLENIFLNNPRVKIYNQDSREFIKDFNDWQHVSPFGIVIVDPTKLPDFNSLIDFVKRDEMTRIDLCIRLNTTNYKRPVGACGWPNLKSILDRLNKIHVWIKRPSNDAFRWTTIFGTNTKIELARRRGYFKIDSPIIFLSPIFSLKINPKVGIRCSRGMEVTVICLSSRIMTGSFSSRGTNSILKFK